MITLNGMISETLEPQQRKGIAIKEMMTIVDHLSPLPPPPKFRIMYSGYERLADIEDTLYEHHVKAQNLLMIERSKELDTQKLLTENLKEIIRRKTLELLSKCDKMQQKKNEEIMATTSKIYNTDYQPFKWGWSNDNTIDKQRSLDLSEETTDKEKRIEEMDRMTKTLFQETGSKPLNIHLLYLREQLEILRHSGKERLILQVNIDSDRMPSKFFMTNIMESIMADSRKIDSKQDALNIIADAISVVRPPSRRKTDEKSKYAPFVMLVSECRNYPHNDITFSISRKKSIFKEDDDNNGVIVDWNVKRSRPRVIHTGPNPSAIEWKGEKLKTIYHDGKYPSRQRQQLSKKDNRQQNFVISQPRQSTRNNYNNRNKVSFDNHNMYKPKRTKTL